MSYEGAASGGSWALPVGSVVLALLTFPLMFVAPMSFVIALAVATGASVGGLVAAQDDRRPKAQRLVGSVACLSVPAVLVLLTLPFVLQN